MHECGAFRGASRYFFFLFCSLCVFTVTCHVHGPPECVRDPLDAYGVVITRSFARSFPCHFTRPYSLRYLNYKTAETVQYVPCKYKSAPLHEYESRNSHQLLSLPSSAFTMTAVIMHHLSSRSWSPSSRASILVVHHLPGVYHR